MSDGSPHRLVIAGVPRAGKTTAAEKFGELRQGDPIRHTDDLIADFEWSAASLEVSRWFDEPGPWLIEGVATVRALRKWLAAHPTGTPCDGILWLDKPREQLTPGQTTLAKGCRTVLEGIREELERRGVEILEL